MGRYNEWGRDNEGPRYSSYDDGGYARRGNRGGGNYRGGYDDYKGGRGNGGYRGRGGGDRGGFRNNMDGGHGYNSGMRGRGGKPTPKYNDDRGFRGNGGGGGGNRYRGGGSRGGYRDNDRGGMPYGGRDGGGFNNRDNRGSRYDKGSRESSYSSRGSGGWRSDRGSGGDRHMSSFNHGKKDLALLMETVFNAMESRSRYSRPPRRGGRFMGNYKDRRDSGHSSSSTRYEPYRRERSRSRRRVMDDVKDPTVEEVIAPNLLHCFICEWETFSSKEEFLEHLKGKDHILNLKAYHDVNDSVLEILRGNAQIIALQEIREKKLKDKFTHCDRCQCKIHETQKKTHTESIEHQQVKKLLNVNCCDQLNLYMDRRGWHQLSHHLLTIGHLKKKGGDTKEPEKPKLEKLENETEEEFNERVKASEETKNINEPDQQKINGTENNDGETVAEEQPGQQPTSNSDDQESSTVVENKIDDAADAEMSLVSQEEKKQNPAPDSQGESDMGTEEMISDNDKEAPKKSSPQTIHLIDCIDKMFKITGRAFQVYRPTNPFGEEYLTPETKFYCEPCSEHVYPMVESMEDHCRSKEHYEKVCQHLESIKKKEDKPSEQEDDENAELFEDLDNLETVDEAVEDEEDEVGEGAGEQDEEEPMDFSQEVIEAVGEKLFCEDDASDNEEDKN